MRESEHAVGSRIFTSYPVARDFAQMRPRADVEERFRLLRDAIWRDWRAPLAAVLGKHGLTVRIDGLDGPAMAIMGCVPDVNGAWVVFHEDLPSWAAWPILRLARRQLDLTVADYGPVVATPEGNAAPKWMRLVGFEPAPEGEPWRYDGRRNRGGRRARGGGAVAAATPGGGVGAAAEETE